jgi:hypothetical protein
MFHSRPGATPASAYKMQQVVLRRGENSQAEWKEVKEAEKQEQEYYPATDSK